MEKFPQFSSNLSLAGLSLDVAAIVFVAAIIFLFGFAAGRDRLLSTLLGLYAAALITYSSPQVLDVFVAYNIKLPPFTQAVIFVAFFILLNFLLSGRIFLNIFRFSAKGLSSLWQVIGLSLLISGLFVSLFLQFLPFDTIAISSPVAYIFRDGLAPFLWAVSPVLFLIFLRVEDNDQEDKNQ